MPVEQLSVFVKNKSGCLNAIASALKKASINIRALSLSDTSDFGVLRFIVDDPEKAREVLRHEGFPIGSTSVVPIEVEDKAGGMAHVLEILSKYDINIEYLYAYTQRLSDKATLIFRFDSNSRATEILLQHGVRVLTAEEMSF